MNPKSPQNFPEEWLSAFLDNELDEEQRRLVEAELAQNSQLSQTLEELRATRQLVQLLPSFPSPLEKPSSILPTKTWTAEPDEQLDDGLSEQVADPNNDSEAGGSRLGSLGSLAMSSERQLKRALEDQTDGQHSTEFRKHSSQWRNYRWIAIAASLVGVAILASMLWPAKSGLLTGVATDSALPKQMIDELAMRNGSGEKSAAESEFSAPGLAGPGSELSGSGLAEPAAMDQLGEQLGFPMAAEPQGNDAKLDTYNLTDNLAAGLEAGMEQFAPQEKAGGTEGGMEFVNPAERARVMSDSALAMQAADVPLQIPNDKVDLESALQSVDALPPPMRADRFGDPAAMPSAAIPGSNTMQDLGGMSAAGGMGSMPGAAKSGAAERQGALQPNRASKLAAPKQATDRAFATQSTWHRSPAWSEESVISQLESNTLLLPLRSTLRSSYKIPQAAAPIDTSIPMVILRADEKVRKEILSKLQQTVTPALSESSERTTRVIFLSSSELEQVLVNSIKPEDLFWVAPVNQNSPTEQRILILNDR